MKWPTTELSNEIATPSGSMFMWGGGAYLEPFNGSDVMLSARESIDELKESGPGEVILMVRVTGCAVDQNHHDSITVIDQQGKAMDRRNEWTRSRIPAFVSGSSESHDRRSSCSFRRTGS